MVSTILVELKSKKYVQSISISDESHDRVFFEGDLGKLLRVSFIESRALELVGENGVVRVEIDEDILQKVLKTEARELNLVSESGSNGSEVY